METFERVLKVLKHKGVTKAWLANKLGIPKPTFNGWFCVEKQDKLEHYAKDMHAIWPDISREWLMFEEGDMFDSGQTKADMAQKIAELEAQHKRDQDTINRLTRLLLQDADAADTANAAKAK